MKAQHSLGGVCGMLGCLAALSAAEEQCGGGSPMPQLKFGVTSAVDTALADRICCHNHRYAEPAGFQQQAHIDLFGTHVSTVGDNIFYDSVCGKPLFVAPRGRSFTAWRDESLHHGWPSFRPAEIVWENVIIHDGGRMESVCGTHLGHNLPSGGADRYCIDLVCVAGAPPADSAFNSSSFVSVAPTDSGKEPASPLRAMAAFTGGALALFLLYGITRTWRRGARHSRTLADKAEVGLPLETQLVEQPATKSGTGPTAAV